MTVEARLFTVHGRVQGVWFRDSTRRQAERLGITGHAINLSNGNVEVFAIGSVEALAQLEQWLHVGPPVSNVSKVEVSHAEVRPTAAFTIG